MAMVFMDGFDHYGVDDSMTLDGKHVGRIESIWFGDTHVGLLGKKADRVIFDDIEINGTFEIDPKDRAAVYSMFYGADPSAPPLNRKQRRAEMARAGRKKRMEGKPAQMVIIDDPYTTTTTMDIETDSFTWDGPTTTIVHNTLTRRDERYGNMNRAQRRKVMAQERRAMRKWK